MKAQDLATVSSDTSNAAASSCISLMRHLPMLQPITKRCGANLKPTAASIEKKKEIVALSKSDALDQETLAERREALKKAARKTPLVLSAVAGHGVQDALYAIAREVSRTTAKEDEAQPDTGPWQP